MHLSRLADLAFEKVHAHVCVCARGAVDLLRAVWQADGGLFGDVAILVRACQSNLAVFDAKVNPGPVLESTCASVLKLMQGLHGRSSLLPPRSDRKLATSLDACLAGVVACDADLDANRLSRTPALDTAHRRSGDAAVAVFVHEWAAAGEMSLFLLPASALVALVTGVREELDVVVARHRDPGVWTAVAAQVCLRAHGCVHVCVCMFTCVIVCANVQVHAHCGYASVQVQPAVSLHPPHTHVVSTAPGGGVCARACVALAGSPQLARPLMPTFSPFAFEALQSDMLRWMYPG
jgi:hypothetical protein